MSACLMNYFVLNDELKSTCDFDDKLIKENSGVYEVFRIIDGIPLFLDEHLTRFYRSANEVYTHFSVSESQVKNRLKRLIESNSAKSCNIFFQYIELPNRGNIFAAWIPPFRYPTVEQVIFGVDLVSIAGEREKPNIKRTNLPARIAADELKSSSGIYEVILVNRNNEITEGSRSNIYFIRNNEIFTPSLNLVLPGITQSKVFEAAAALSVPVHQVSISLKEIGIFEAAFISSTSNRVLPVKSLDGIPFNPGNKLIGCLKSGFEKIMNENLSGFKW